MVDCRWKCKIVHYTFSGCPVEKQWSLWNLQAGDGKGVLQINWVHAQYHWVWFGYYQLFVYRTKSLVWSLHQMVKLIKELKKENEFLKGKCENSDVALVKLIEEVMRTLYKLVVMFQNQVPCWDHITFYNCACLLWAAHIDLLYHY